jgi:tRNA dimethylallyltransferase
MQLDSTLLRKCWFLAGPTACGKTAAALILAQRINAEIVALDSMSLYRGMDIGTAKPTADEQAAVPHHLIDILDPWEDYSVAEYLRAAESACREIVDCGRTPLFVGGTGLYLRALLRGVFEGPPADWAFRTQLNADLEREGMNALHARLRVVDPDSAVRLHPHDARRVIRALEVHHLTGRPASELQQQIPLPPELRPRHVYWLEPPRAWLHDRIDQRVRQMITAGFVEEVRRLMAGPRPPGRTAGRALGYAQIIDHLAGRCSLDAAVAEIQTATRQFAKRQHTWFRNLVECRAIPIAGNESSEESASLILSAAEA